MAIAGSSEPEGQSVASLRSNTSRGLLVGHVLRAAVVGCGVAGPAVGTFLQRLGWKTTVFERAPKLGPVGAGLLLQPTGQLVLEQLGVLEAVRQRAARIDRLLGVTVAGRRVLDLEYRDLDTSLHGLGVTRGALFGALLHSLRESGAVIAEGREIRSVRDGAEGAFVVDAAGREEGPFDLVVVCDGARSVLRNGGADRAKDTAYSWGALWCVLPDEDGVFAGVLSQVYDGTGKMVGFLPTGRIDGTGPPTVSVFWSLRTAEFERWRQRPIEELAGAMVAMDPRAAGVLKALRSWDQVVAAQYHDAKAKPAARGRTVFVGDAAHAMSPQLGQGANLALWDAWELSRLLPRGDDGFAEESPLKVEDAVRRFAASRAAHTAFYHRASRWLTPWFQSNYEPLAWARDLLMLPLSRVPWVRRQMLLSLAGVKAGVFFKSPVEREVMGASGNR